jgi:PleD family two-component response regulator
MLREYLYYCFAKPGPSIIVSIGVAYIIELDIVTEPNELAHKADLALCNAKCKGKNRVACMTRQTCHITCLSTQ